MYDVIVAGGGAAGIAAAISAVREGAKVALIEQSKPGGRLLQSIHNGFGDEFFGEDLTGPEFAARLASRLVSSGIKIIIATVTDVSSALTVTVRRPSGKLAELKAKAIVLATGSKEEPEPSTAPTSALRGVYTATEAQRLINIEGKIIGKKAVVYGSNTLAVILARRLTLEGVKVVCVCESREKPVALPKDIVQCLEDFDIPLYLNTTVAAEGESALRGVYIKKALSEPSFIACDTLILSPELSPDDTLTVGAGIVIDGKTRGAEVTSALETSVPGIFAAGSALHTQTSADDAAFEGMDAGRNAALYAEGKQETTEHVRITAGEGIHYVMPHTAPLEGRTKIFFRAADFRKAVRLDVRCGQDLIFAKRYPALLPGLLENIEISLNGLSQDVRLSLEEQ
ncbi:MAG: FAD-dependent oxidoreductase [Clostridia bacterium]|nr:FAD-dependent oxidoreductase [Clostridia bacterium]